MKTLIRNARVLTLDGPNVRRGDSMGDLSPVEDADVLIAEGRIASLIHGEDRARVDADDTVDADGRVLMPAFVDAHTHACWAGERLDEWELKQRGATYLELLEAGGGIMSTVRSVRRATQKELADSLTERLEFMAQEGTTTLEVKSGYGLSTEDELKMLRAIDDASARSPLTVVKTALIAHAVDSEQDGFCEKTIEETLPAVHAEFPDVAIDAYTEKGAWSLEQTVRLFEKSLSLGHPIRVHTDQFNELGMTSWAIEHGAISVDHLEATSPENLRSVAESDTFGVMLPCSGFQVDGRYGNGRALIDQGGALVMATNCNPGSAPCSSMPMAIALATRNLGIQAGEAIVACTRNAASLLGYEDRGRIAQGFRADLILLRHRDERQLGYEFGGNPVAMTWCGGQRI